MALAEIADFVVNVFQLINYLLKISIFIGKLLVEVISNAAFISWKILQAIGRFMVVFYEDYSYFVEDFKNALSSIAIFFIECLTAICGGVVKAVVSIGNAAVAGYHGVGELLSGRLLTVPIFTLEFVKQLLVIVGNGVWFLVTLPGHLAKNFWEYLDTGLEVVGHFSKDVGAKSMEIVSRLGYYLVKDVPLQSVAGIFILILAYINPKCSKRIAIFCFRILRYFYRKMLPYGRGIRRKYLQCKQLIAQIIDNILVTVLAGSVYLRTRAITIYDTEVHRTALFFRNFFTFSDRRQRQQQQQHLSRIENRRDHSDSEQSSRSSSASSDQSTQSRSLRPIAQNSSNSNNGSPSKKRSEGSTIIGLCIICEDNEKAVVLVPCGHMCLCKRCADQLGHYDRYCPICRTLIHRKVDVFI
ncbi:uncharacterized protein LOC135710045 [Ochlerotatus camptorhynchus]|uniref:uncharacterized protein LOC135710045 n=1 Tax=Ochlerotatus camptorhynchus TaxID=644619 RepID=UPI0031E3FA85